MHVMKIDDKSTYRIHAAFEEIILLLVTYLGYYASLDNIQTVFQVFDRTQHIN